MWNDQILSLLGNGNGKAINSTISVWTRVRSLLFSSNPNSLPLSNRAPRDNREKKKMKGCEVFFQRRSHERRRCRIVRSLLPILVIQNVAIIVRSRHNSVYSSQSSSIFSIRAFNVLFISFFNLLSGYFYVSLSLVAVPTDWILINLVTWPVLPSGSIAYTFPHDTYQKKIWSI